MAGFTTREAARQAAESTARHAARAAANHAGSAGERQALAHLVHHGLRLVARNYRVAAGPRAHGGEVDLIVRDRDGTLVFVEVRVRRDSRHGGAAASVTLTKQRRVRHAARHYLQRFPSPPPCRFDVIVIDGGHLEWLRGAFQDEP